MSNKLSTIKVKHALFWERQLLKGAAEVFGDRSAAKPLPGSEIRIRDNGWESHYDALGG